MFNNKYIVFDLLELYIPINNAGRDFGGFWQIIAEVTGS